ncbi:hypothetical protein CO174_03985 [Candidatus Uhrbacteria bacterium CG_4_9_14_3_um_filter_50_9]|uniref:Uncharacterized protein n=1 Tax=Candidatus Uhrbacteria bacterium CG_4_9_14_3_um_filter_50_9 TaxID=1975035 RepID=A0A2M7XBR1_9BACT|nr:MAG: hypothetical protein CO174_03985 [Candidatus Uhrbacteria bacterium CG_4_9_14_3_um_filter_50_9]
MWHWVIGVSVVVLLVLGWYYISLQDGETTSIGSGEFQAIFLDNGQVYFGRLDASGDRFYSLTDVFYLQSGATPIETTNALALTKLGNEAHGPEDQMQINIDHILFIEDMKNDSKVVQAINDYKNADN